MLKLRPNLNLDDNIETRNKFLAEMVGILNSSFLNQPLICMQFFILRNEAHVISACCSFI